MDAANIIRDIYTLELYDDGGEAEVVDPENLGSRGEQEPQDGEGILTIIKGDYNHPLELELIHIVPAEEGEFNFRMYLVRQGLEILIGSSQLFYPQNFFRDQTPYKLCCDDNFIYIVGSVGISVYVQAHYLK